MIFWGLGKLGIQRFRSSFMFMPFLLVLILMIKLMMNAKMEKLAPFDYVKWKEPWRIRLRSTFKLSGEKFGTQRMD